MLKNTKCEHDIIKNYLSILMLQLYCLYYQFAIPIAIVPVYEVAIDDN